MGGRLYEQGGPLAPALGYLEIIDNDLVGSIDSVLHEPLEIWGSCYGSVAYEPSAVPTMV